MKLYTKQQLLKSSLFGIIGGAVLSGAVFFCVTSVADKNQAEENETLSGEMASGENSSLAENDYKNAGTENLSQNGKNIAGDEEFSEVLRLVSNSSVQYTEDEAQNIYVYNKCNEAVVNITTQVMGINWFLEPVISDGGSGSGSIIDERGYVVTNVHVISDANKIYISLADGSSYEGVVVGTDIESDIAVLKFDPPENVKLKTINYGDSTSLKVGQKVIAIGNPFALERTMTTGIVSGLGRPIQESKNVIIRDMIQTDAAINPGNSGGPLLDTRGNMIGINTMIISNSGSSSGVGFAVPVQTAKRVVNDLIRYGKVRRGKILIEPVQMTQAIANYAGIDISHGILVSTVKEGSSAEKAGLRGGTTAVQYRSRFSVATFYIGGDIITAVDNISVRTYADYTSALESKRPNDTVTLTVYRDGKYEKLRVVLDGDTETLQSANVTSS